VTAYLFVGPTLPRAEIGALCDFVCLPPAAQGDVLHLAKARPRAIGIIDGYFDGVPAVWHKEILWAIREGIHVFGASSMGALRAAELAPFGMRGVGRIFEAYRAGVLGASGDEAFEDDDEVCVVHGPPESGYVAASEALVNIRRTLDDAHGRRKDAGRVGDGDAGPRGAIVERKHAHRYRASVRSRSTCTRFVSPRANCGAIRPNRMTPSL
jgi:hypothetical protein